MNTTSQPRSSKALKHRHRENRALLNLHESSLSSQMAYRSGDELTELKHAARSMNNHIRNKYQPFIHDVGRNVYPLIIFTDHEVDGPSGVGSTMTLYLADGSVTQVFPARSSNYELYKSTAHLFMGLAVEVEPYFLNSVDDEDELCPKDVPWHASLTEYVQQARIFRRALLRVAKVETVVKEMDGLKVVDDDEENDKKESKDDIVDTSYGLPPLEMRETMNSMLASVIDFCNSSLSTGVLDVQRWKELNKENFPHIKTCMEAATKAQADACISQVIEWRDMIGPEEWRELYVVIPTVWAVNGENPRHTMFSQLMDEDRVDTHLITSEYPRNHSEARTLLGRIVGDRAIGRFVFGDETKEQKIKTMGLSSEVDVVQDDALVAIWNALTEKGCPIRCHRKSNASSICSVSSVSMIERKSLS